MKMHPAALVALLALVGACGSGVSAEPAPQSPAVEANPPVEAKPAAVPAATPAASAEAGKKAFSALGCAVCHSATAAGVPAPKGAEDTSFDLPGPGGTYEASWLKLYLTKQETISGRKHPTRMGGEAAQQDALVAWLAAPPPKK